MNKEEVTKTQLARPSHHVPSDQPNRVLDLANRLLPAYHVQGGHAHLAGCTLDEVPVVRIPWQAEGQTETVHVLVDRDEHECRVVDAALYDELNLGDVMSAQRPISVSPRDVEQLVEDAVQCVEGSRGSGALAADPIAIIWCKFARGKLQFTIGDAIGQVAFSGWARTLEAPPFHCTATGADGFEVAATSDGRVVAAERLATCEISGQEFPDSDLVQCAATGKLVDRKLTTKCPVSDEDIIQTERVECPMCHLLVSPNTISRQRCAGCRRISTVDRSDPRIRQLMTRYPRLSNWQWLRLAETSETLTVIASGIFERRLLVVDKDTLDLRYAARGTRLSPWSELPLNTIEQQL